MTKTCIWFDIAFFRHNTYSTVRHDSNFKRNLVRRAFLIHARCRDHAGMLRVVSAVATRRKRRVIFIFLAKRAYSWQKEHSCRGREPFPDSSRECIYISPWLTLARSCFLETGPRKFLQKYSPIRGYMSATS